MKSALRPAVVLLGFFTVITGVLYPVTVTAVAQAVLPEQANGSLIVREGRVVGSSLIGQSFGSPRRFWGRPSATSPGAYDGGASAGSNLGPTNSVLLTSVRGRVAALRAAHPERAAEPVPVDLVTASGSGLDPHLSPASALYQVERVARATGLPVERVRALVEAHTEGRGFGVLGEPRVNVLRLNLALDGLVRTGAGR